MITPRSTGDVPTSTTVSCPAMGDNALPVLFPVRWTTPMKCLSDRQSRLTPRQERVAVDCLLFCFFNPGDSTAVRARCLSALKALDLRPKENTSCSPPHPPFSSGLDVVT